MYALHFELSVILVDKLTRTTNTDSKRTSLLECLWIEIRVHIFYFS